MRQSSAMRWRAIRSIWQSWPCLLLLGTIGVDAGLLHAQTREQPQATTPQPVQNGSPAAETSGPVDPLTTSTTGARATLGPGDLIDISVFDTPELTQRVRVNSDGKIKLALIGEIDVHGMSADDLQATIRQQLIDGHFVKDPQVAVFVSAYAGQVAYVTGEVSRPGAYPLLRSHRLLDLISVAGGQTPQAGNQVTVTRKAEPAQTLQIDLASKDESVRNPVILPGDSITVGKTGIVYVLGDVTRPGGFLLDRRTTLSVMQALALAEGVTATGSLKNARLFRGNNQAREEIPVNIKHILNSSQPDLLLQSGDILYIYGSATRGLARMSIQTILGTASGVATYASYR